MGSSYAAVDNIITYKVKRLPRMNLNLIKSNNDWEYIWNFKFRVDSITEEDIYPFTKMYTGTHENNVGALFGGPPVTIRQYLKKETFVLERLKGTLGECE